ncbi:MAG: hypothetical protein LUH05_08065 [Candidatus Gastranaerophilales bacterium]|nr:hypothetical protein [Candidatus Gastranaerophilales bacterium]
MKKKIILTVIFMILMVNIPSMSQITTNDVISAIENNFWGYDYSNESETKRLERIENHLYGEKKSGNIQKRLENIQNDTGIAIEEKKPQTVSKEDLNNNNKTVQKISEIPQNLKEDSSVEYPIVDKMEEEILHTTYKNENIYNRLNRLEEKVFNKTSNEDLSTRVNKLASAIAPAQKNYQNQSYSSQNQDNYYSNSGFNSVDDTAMPFQIAVIEEDLLRKSYVDDNISNRLGRLEQKLFNRTFTNDNDVTRLQRIMVAYEAKKNSYKYENNRKMQNMATFSQIGGLLLMILAILL